MSELADRARSERALWATPGSSHDRVIRAARIVLPVGIAIIAILLAVAPLTIGQDISFVLAKDRVEVAGERLRVTNARYKGQDSKGQSFLISAGSAVQTTSAEPVVRLSDLAAMIQLKDGPAAIAAQRGVYDMEGDTVQVKGPVLFKTADGYRVLTRDVGIDLNSRTFASEGRVEGRMPLGTFSADHLRGDLEQRVVTLDGRARLHIVQAQSRGTR